MKSLCFTLVISLACSAGCSTLPASHQSRTPEANHSYVISGDGSPTIVLESGLGDGKESWEPVYNQVAQLSTVFAYDRAGYGTSRSSNRSRDGLSIVSELRSTLQALDLAPPYVLVGHSIGGTYMELFARTYPEEVAGVVLVDSRHADFTRQCQLADAGSCTPPALLSLLMPNGPKQEMAGGDRTMDEVLSAGPFPDVPLVVLTSVKQFLMREGFVEVWLETQKSLAAFSNQSTHTVCKRCGHYIHKDDPILVIDAVTSVIEQVRRNHAGAPNGG